MAFVHKPNTGTIRKTRQKNNDKSPDYWGDANINGTIMSISGWINQDSSGANYLSLKFSPKEQTQGQRPPASGQHGNRQQPSTPNRGQQQQLPEDDIPF